MLYDPVAQKWIVRRLHAFHVSFCFFCLGTLQALACHSRWEGGLLNQHQKSGTFAPSANMLGIKQLAPMLTVQDLWGRQSELPRRCTHPICHLEILEFVCGCTMP